MKEKHAKPLHGGPKVEIHESCIQIAQPVDGCGGDIAYEMHDKARQDPIIGWTYFGQFHLQVPQFQESA